MKDNIDEAEENNNLTKFILENLDSMMIEYNKGLIIQMTLADKRHLKQIIQENNTKEQE